MELDLEWQEPGWRRVLEGIPRGTEIPVERFFAILGSVDEEEAREAALCLEERGVGLDVSHLPQSGSGALLQRLTLEAELVREGRLPGGLEGGDPLRLYWQELEQLPRLTEAQARESLSRGENPNRLTEGLLWLVAQEAPAFAGQGVLLLDLMQEGAMGLMGAMEDAGENVLERARWHVRQAMARAVALQYMVSGEAQRLLASVRAYQQADRRLLERLGRKPGPEELAQELKNWYGPVIFVGDGANLCYNTIGIHEERFRLAPEHRRHQRASGVALAAEAAIARGESGDGAALQPNYLRLSQAERERLERLSK